MIATKLRQTSSSILLVVLLGAISRLGLPLSAKVALALALTVVVELLTADPRAAIKEWLERSVHFHAAISIALLLLLAPVLQTVIIMALLGLGWLVWLRLAPRGWHPPVVALTNQFFSLWAIFLAAAIWRLPNLVVLAAIWGASFLISRQMLQQLGEKTATLLAAAWALTCAQAAWLFAIWLVNYTLLGGWVIVPQPAVVLTALGYCFGGIYIAHLRAQLSRTRLTEYLLIGLSLMMIVIAGTKWNGSV